MKFQNIVTVILSYNNDVPLDSLDIIKMITFVLKYAHFMKKMAF